MRTKRTTWKTRPSPAADIWDSAIRVPEKILPSFSNGRTRTRRNIPKNRDAVGKNELIVGEDNERLSDETLRRARLRAGIAQNEIGVRAKRERFCKSGRQLEDSPSLLSRSLRRNDLEETSYHRRRPTRPSRARAAYHRRRPTRPSRARPSAGS